MEAIANFSRTEQDSYQDSLKYYRDMNNVVDTARQEGEKKGQSNMLLRLLPRTVGKLSDEITTQISQLSLEQLDTLTEIFLDFNEIKDLRDWLIKNQW